MTIKFDNINVDQAYYQGVAIRLPENERVAIQNAVNCIIQSQNYRSRIRAFNAFRKVTNLTKAISYLTQMSLDAPYFLLSLATLPVNDPNYLEAEDFATLMIFWQVIKESGVSLCSFIDFGQEENLPTLHDSLMYMVKKSDPVHAHKTSAPFLSMEEEKNLVQALQVSHFLKRMAIVVDQEKETKKNIRDRIIEIGGAVLGVMPDPERKMMPSMGLVRRIFEFAFKNEAIAPKIVIGTSSCEEILEGEMKGCRDVAIEFPFAPLPKMADHYPVLQPSDFILHDLYHLLAASSIPLKDRLFFLNLANRLSCVKEQHHGVQKACQLLRNKCVDLDFGYFRFYRFEIQNGKIESSFVQYLELIRHLFCSFKEIEQEMKLSIKEFELLRNSTIKYLIKHLFTKEEKRGFFILNEDRRNGDKRLDHYRKMHVVFQYFLMTD